VSPVVLLHGLLRSARSMTSLQRALEAEGHEVWARSYASQRRSIEESATEIAAELRARYAGRSVMLVTHSLGGIIARHLAGPVGEGLRIERIVMLAPPNRGSRLARRLGDLRLFRRLYGPAGQQLRAHDDAGWPVPTVPVAVIAGTEARGLNPTGWLSWVTGLIPPDQPSDGTVLVEETHLPRMADFATVTATHTFIMDHPEVHEMVRRFLREGRLR
jgi:triacylglycerol lipase